jgi:sodium-independent sulfate anion transporter 11
VKSTIGVEKVQNLSPLFGFSTMKCAFNWKDRIPIVKWLPRYSFHSFQCDFIAGITVALMVIPQALAYAVIAGLPTQYGLYSAFMGGFVYCLLGSSKDLAVGPAAIMALMAGAFGRKNDPNFAITLSLFCGVVLLFMGILSLGFVVRLIPIPVVSGFTSAASIIIACEQLPNLLGLSIVSDEFFPLLKETFSNISQTRIWDVVLGVACMAILEIMRNFGKIEWPSENAFPPSLLQKIARKFIWVMEIGRNAVVVFACMLVAYAFHCVDRHPFSLTGKVREGLPPFKVW